MCELYVPSGAAPAAPKSEVRRQRVEIDTPGVTVRVEADGSLAEVADRALDLFERAGGWPQPSPGPAGFAAAERRGTGEVARSSMRWAPRLGEVDGA